MSDGRPWPAEFVKVERCKTPAPPAPFEMIWCDPPKAPNPGCRAFETWGEAPPMCAVLTTTVAFRSDASTVAVNTRSPDGASWTATGRPAPRSSRPVKFRGRCQCVR